MKQYINLTTIKSKLSVTFIIAATFCGIGSLNNTALAEVNQLAENAGLRIKRSQIMDAFHGHLTKYIGDCPGDDWSGSAVSRKIRFISFSTPPSQNLKVRLENANTGESLRKKYTEPKGSSDFSLIKLGNGDGTHSVNYKIYNKKTDEVIETGSFSYNVESSSETIKRDGQWKLELFCASDESIPVKQCEYVAKRERKYCQNLKTSDTRSPQLVAKTKASSYSQIASRIKSSDRFTVRFDKVKNKFNDIGWTGNTDPMGRLMAGLAYQVTYIGRQYTTRGYNESTKSQTSATYGNANPDDGEISLWGRIYTFDDKGNVYDPEYGLVGTLSF